MRRTRAAYHYAIRQARRDEESIVRERIAEAFLTDPTRNFWKEVKRIRNNKTTYNKTVDGCTDENSIAQVFASKYKSLYTSVSYDSEELKHIITEIDASMLHNARASAFVIKACEVKEAIEKLKLHKSDGGFMLSSDHFVNAGFDLSIHISFLFTAIISHGSVPRDFVASTVIHRPIPKKINCDMSDSENFRGISLSSLFGKIFDNVILSQFHENLCTSDLQFGFKQNSSSNMCTMILKETVAYYLNKGSPIFCTFLDARKAFDRVNYCKLFRLLIKRDLPGCIIRALINMYTGHLMRISWAGVVSDYFNALNGVKQGEVISPILFCIYIDDLLVSLSQLGVGCYIAGNFVGAIAYADDIVLISLTPMGMRKLLFSCDTYASDFDIIFNASKSEFLVCIHGKLRSMFNNFNLNGCLFYIGGRPIENVTSYSHLGHIINCHSDDNDDVLQRRCNFTVQANNVFCFFKTLDMHIKIKLFKSYCSSTFGSELWSLEDDIFQDFCCSWRTAIRGLLNLPYNAHCFLLPILTGTLPVFDEIC